MCARYVICAAACQASRLLGPSKKVAVPCVLEYGTAMGSAKESAVDLACDPQVR